MSKERTKILLRDIEIFCDEFGITPDTFTGRMKYPRLVQRLQQGKYVKEVTMERVYTEMELQRFKMAVKEVTTLRQAVEVSVTFLKGRSVEIP